MKFQSGDKVRYIDEGFSGGPETGKVYVVSRRSATDTGVHLVGFNSPGDWWLDRRFELYEQNIYVVLTEHSRETPSGAFNPKLEHFTKAQKFTKEELKTWLEKEHRSISNPSYEVFKLVPAKLTVSTVIEVEE